MHCEWWFGFPFPDSDSFTASYHYELPPTPTIAQLSLVNYSEGDDQSSVTLNFKSVDYLDGAVTRRDDFDASGYVEPTIVIRNGMARIDWVIEANCYVTHMINLFFWDSVYETPSVYE